MARLQTSLRQASRLLFTSAVRWTCCLAAFLRECCTRVNMPLDPETAGVMLPSIPRSLCPLLSDVVCAVLGVAASVASTFSCGLGGSCSKWVIVPRSHLRTVFQMDQAPYP